MLDLKAEIALLPEPVTDQMPPHWEYWQWELWHRAQTEPAENFLRWPCIYHTMLQDHWPQVVELEREAMLRWEGTFPAAITGLPDLQPALSQELNNFRQMYHLWVWGRMAHKRLASLTRIVEIGGGYGAMAMMARRMGFTGEYLIYDLPEYSALQRWFLDKAGVVANFASLLPADPQPTDLLIGLYSLAEMPFALRAQVLAAYPAQHYFYLYSGQWETYDNVAYFQQQQPGTWKHLELTHLPDRNNWYSVSV